RSALRDDPGDATAHDLDRRLLEPPALHRRCAQSGADGAHRQAGRARTRGVSSGARRQAVLGRGPERTVIVERLLRSTMASLAIVAASIAQPALAAEAAA